MDPTTTSSLSSEKEMAGEIIEIEGNKLTLKRLWGSRKPGLDEVISINSLNPENKNVLERIGRVVEIKTKSSFVLELQSLPPVKIDTVNSYQPQCNDLVSMSLIYAFNDSKHKEISGKLSRCRSRIKLDESLVSSGFVTDAELVKGSFFYITPRKTSASLSSKKVFVIITKAIDEKNVTIRFYPFLNPNFENGIKLSENKIIIKPVTFLDFSNTFTKGFVINGKVIQVLDARSVVVHFQSFTRKMTVIKKFEPKVDDLVTFIWSEKLVKPYKKIMQSGKVSETFSGEDAGVISNFVLYNGKKLQVSDSVKFVAVRCISRKNGEKYIWRATEVTLIKKTSTPQPQVSLEPVICDLDVHGLVVVKPFLNNLQYLQIMEIPITVKNRSKIKYRICDIRFDNNVIKSFSVLRGLDSIIAPKSSNSSIKLKFLGLVLGPMDMEVEFEFKQLGKGTQPRVLCKVVLETMVTHPDANEEEDEDEYLCLNYLDIDTRNAIQKVFDDDDDEEYEIPLSLEEEVVKKRISNLELIENYSYLGRPVLESTYGDKFHLMLYMEEISARERMKEYDMKGVQFVFYGKFLTLKLKEKLKVSFGDSVYAVRTDRKDEVVYQGHIGECDDKTLIPISFVPIFHFLCREDALYDVRFEPSRSGYIKRHRAVDEMLSRKELDIIFPKDPSCGHRNDDDDDDNNELDTFPSDYEHIVKQTGSLTFTSANRFFSHVNSVIEDNNNDNNNNIAGNGLNEPLYSNLKIHDTEWINKRLNIEQKNAVTRVVRGECRQFPFCIYGPPGTGKTSTVVEAILQVFRLIPKSRILVTAPSNSAADLLAERMIDFGTVTKRDLIRIHSMSRPKKPDFIHVSKRLKEYSSSTQSIRDLHVLQRIVVMTCETAYFPFQPKSFTHCFLDEAACTTEPDALMAISCVAKKNYQIILAGDPMQLGPVVQSTRCKMYGLSMSLMERLLSLEMYSPQVEAFPSSLWNLNPKLVAILLRNYRNHPKILELPSSLFYNSDLIALSEDSRRFVGNKQILYNLSCPIIFHGVRASNGREKNSPSWFNRTEAFLVFRYLKYLYSNNVSCSDIGIISPYRKQIEKLTDIINNARLPLPKMGSVEEFQGQEKPVIIVSNVRSCINNNFSRNSRHCLGFVDSPNKFNVTVTRAASLLIVIGNPHVLSISDTWRIFIRWCFDHGVYIGCDLPKSIIKETLPINLI